MSGPASNGSGSNANGTPSSGQQAQSDAASSANVREFIYFDETRIFSYLSQIEGGLRLLRQSVTRELDVSSTESGGDKKSGEHNFEGSASPAAAALAQVLLGVAGVVPLGLLAGMGGKYSYKRNWENSTDVHKTSSYEDETSADTSILHHKAFDIVVKKLEERLKIYVGSLTIHSISIEDNEGKFYGGTVNTVPVPRSIIDQMMAIDMAHFAIINSTERVVAPLQRKNFVVNPYHAAVIYGTPTTTKFTIVGIPGQIQVAAPLSSGIPTTPEALAQLNDGSSPANSALGVDVLVTRMFNLHGQRVAPLAIYREI